MSLQPCKNNVYDRVDNVEEAMSKTEFRAITLPEGLYMQLENYVEQSNGSYVSVTEVVREALRDYLKRQSE
jgi:Arc/MetJ-type ribon-helix-helix transcriptional regulator